MPGWDTGRKLALALLVLLLIALRFWRITADPYDIFSHYGLSQLTDPYFYTLFARNKVLFGSWDPFDFTRFHVFALSLVSLVSWLLFSLAGVSRLTANVSGALLSLGAVFLFAWSLRGNNKDNQRAVLALFLLLGNALLFFYGRFPLLESGLLFLVSLTCWLHFRYGRTYWGIFAVGTGIALCALMGKLFGFMLMGPAVLTTLWTGRKHAFRHVAVLFGGLTCGVLGYAVILHLFSPGSLWQYFQEVNATVVSGTVAQTPVDIIENSFAYLSRPGISHFCGALVVVAALGWILRLLSGRLSPQNRADTLLFFCLAWIASGLIILGPNVYRPIRYSLVLLFPLAYMAADALYFLFRSEMRLYLPSNHFSRLGITLALTIIASTFYAATMPDQFVNTSLPRAVPLLTLVGAAISVVLWLVLRRQPLHLNVYTGRTIAIAGVIVIFGQFAYLLATALPRSYHEMTQLSHDIGQVIDERAILAGVFAPALTIDTKHKVIIGESSNRLRNPGLIKEYHITHLAITTATWDKIKEFYHLDGYADLLLSKWVRGTVIQCYRIPSESYPATGFDTLVNWYFRDSLSRARKAADGLVAEFPDNQLIATTRLEVVLNQGDVSEIIREFNSALLRYRDSYDAQWIGALLLAQVYLRTKNQAVKAILDRAIRRMHHLHPALAPSENEVYRIARQVLNTIAMSPPPLQTEARRQGS